MQAISILWMLVASAPVLAQCEHELEASVGVFTNLGCSLALSGDRVIVGARGDNTHKPATGAAYVFERTSSGWNQTTKLAGSDSQRQDLFGVSVALEGQRAVIGSERHDGAASDQGAAYVFERMTQTSWGSTAKLTASDPSFLALFGSSVALSSDRILIGAPGEYPPTGMHPGAAYVFELTQTGWTETAKLIASDAQPQDLFGKALDLEQDIAVVGAQLNDTSAGQDSGAAYVFERTPIGWLEVAKLIPADAAARDFFGCAISLAGDSILIGARGDSDNGAASGSVYFFERTQTGWQEKEKVIANDGQSGDQFGFSVSLLGAHALVGSPNVDSPFLEAGAVYVYAHDGSSWYETRKVTLSEAGERDNLGASVSLDMSRFAAGAPSKSTFAGAASLFEDRLPTEYYCTSKKNSLGCQPAIRFTGCASSTADDGFVVLCLNMRNQKEGLLLYSISGKSIVPFQGGAICLSPPVRRTPARTSGGNPGKFYKDCSGAYRIDMNSFAANAFRGNPTPELRIEGTTVYCQWWARDPDDPFGSSLSDALAYTVGL